MTHSSLQMSQRACPSDSRYQIARAVEARYWQTCRFNPTAGQKFTLDFTLQKAPYQDSIKDENC